MIYKPPKRAADEENCNSFPTADESDSNGGWRTDIRLHPQRSVELQSG